MIMNISVDTLISILTLLLGGGGGAFFTWYWQRKKAKAEAVQAEASAAKELQDMYQQMIADAKTDREDRRAQNEELRAERDHYKNERNELRTQIDTLTRNVAEWKVTSDGKILDLQRQVARNGRQLEAIRPFVCGDLLCRHRQRAIISDTADADTPADIEPVSHDTL